MDATQDAGAHAPMSRCLICRRLHADGDCPTTAGSSITDRSERTGQEIAPGATEFAGSAQYLSHRPRWGILRVDGMVCSSLSPIKRRPPQTWAALSGAAMLLSATGVGLTGSTRSWMSAALQAGVPFVVLAMPILVILVIGALALGAIGRLFVVALTAGAFRLAGLATAAGFVLLRLTIRQLVGRRSGVIFDLRDRQHRIWQVQLLHDGAGLRFDTQVEVVGVVLGGVVHAVVVKLPAKHGVALRPPLALCTLLTACLVAGGAMAAIAALTG